MVLLHNSLLLWCDGISLLQRTEEPHFLTRSIQQAWQLFQNISIKENPISLNSTPSLLFPIAGAGGVGGVCVQLGLYLSTLNYTGFRAPSREVCLCFEQLSGEMIGAEWMQVYLFKPITVLGGRGG